jgi:Na+-driven multidrug efflux pump
MLLSNTSVLCLLFVSVFTAGGHCRCYGFGIGLGVARVGAKRPLSTASTIIARSNSSRRKKNHNNHNDQEVVICSTTTQPIEEEISDIAVAADDADSNNNDTGTVKVKASKREMLTFAIPALGIYLANPLMSNIDNAFVGRTVGTAGLAALSPATICTDQMIYLFSFLGRATTGIVSRAYAAKGNNGTGNNSKGATIVITGNTDAAREAGSAPLTVSLMCGVCLSIFYAFKTQSMLSALNVSPALRSQAASYIYWRGSIIWATLAQAVSLSMLMATRDAMTPLKIIGLAASVNIVTDYMMCVWPFQYGCAGAAAATSFSTLVSCGFMLRALKQKDMLPSIKLPTKSEWMGLLDFTGPLMAITLTRLVGFVSMQRTAMKLGTQSLAGYQLCVNLLMFFLLFGEPISQLSQTQLPALLDDNDAPAVKATLKSIGVLTVGAAIGIGGLSFAAAMFGSATFSADPAVQMLAKATSPALFVAVATAITAIAVDGAMMASRDFGFMLACGFSASFVQLQLLPYCTSISDIFGTFSLRLASYPVVCLLRAGLGYGPIGRVLRKNKNKRNTLPATVSAAALPEPSQ